MHKPPCLQLGHGPPHNGCVHIPSSSHSSVGCHPSQCVCRGAHALLSTEVPSLYTPNQALRLCIPPTHPCLCSPFSFLWLKKHHFSPVPSHIDPWQLPTLGGGSLVRTRMRGEMGSREWILDSGSVKNTPPFL